ncbi:MAG: hypothetical protein U1F43_10880 [Myxococcota bacterium]
MRTLAPLASVLGLACLVTPARASFFDTFGFSARAVGRANAMVALGADYDAAYYNPANILSRKRFHLGLGFDLVAPDLYVNAVSGDLDPILPDSNLGLHLGMSTPISGVFGNKLGFGFAFFHPLTTGTNVSSVDPSVPWFYRYQALPDKLILAAGMAAEPLPWLRLGLGAQVLAALDGRVDAALSLAEGRFLREDIDVDVVPTAGFTAGLALGPFDLGASQLRLGATFRQSLELDYRLPVTVDIAEVGVLSVLVEGTSLYTPSQLAFGIGWESAPAPEPGISLEAGLTWELWSDAPPAGARFVLTIDDTHLRPPTDPQDAPSNIVDVQAGLIPLGARDTLTPRVGLEWRTRLGDLELALRGGWFYRPTPLPRPIYQTNTLDAAAHVVSLGAGFTFGDPTGVSAAPVSIDLTAQLTRLSQRAIEKDPVAGNPIGAYEAGGLVWHLALDLRHDFR